MKFAPFKERIKERLKKSDYYTEDRIIFNDNAGHKTIRFCSAAVIKIRELKSGTRLEVAKRFLEPFRLQEVATFTQSDPEWGKVPFSEAAVENILTGAKTVFEECYKEGRIEIFGCCSRYVECSDQRKCIHPDIKIARGCMYKLNLEKGQIFYGRNCSIDRRDGERKSENESGQGQQQIRLW